MRADPRPDALEGTIPERRGGGWLVGLVLGLVAAAAFMHSLGLFKGEPDSLASQRERDARFLEEQRARPFGEDRQMLAIVAALQGYRGADDGARLRNAVQRRTLMALLGETHDVPRTVGQAIDAERSPREAIGPLRQRVASSVTVRTAPGSPGWLEGSHPSGVRWRWLARNGTHSPIASFTILLSRWTQLHEDKMLLLCEPEAGDPIAPRGEAMAVCKPWVGTPPVMSDKARAMLQDAAMARARPASHVKVADLGFGISAEHMSFGDRECEPAYLPAGRQGCELP